MKLFPSKKQNGIHLSVHHDHVISVSACVFPERMQDRQWKERKKNREKIQTEKTAGSDFETR